MNDRIPDFEMMLMFVKRNGRKLRDEEVTAALRGLARHLVSERMKHEDRWLRMDYMRDICWRIKELSHMKISDLEKITTSYIRQHVAEELKHAGKKRRAIR